MVTILLTGVGSPGTQGTIYSIKNVYRGVVRVIGTDIKNCAGKYLCDRFYKVPKADDKYYISNIKDIYFKEGCNLVVPQTTKETEILSSRKKELEKIKIKILVNDPEVISVVNNKLNLMEKLRENNFDVPEFNLSRNKDELKSIALMMGYPKKIIAVKPSDGNGMRGFRLLDVISDYDYFNEKPGHRISLEELYRILPNKLEFEKPVMLMEYLPGKEWSVDCFKTEERECIVVRERVETRTGISFISKIEHNHHIEKKTREIIEIIGLKGIFGLQFKENEYGDAMILECNPRVQGTMVASTMFGSNLIWYAIADKLKMKYTFKPAHSFINNNNMFYRFFSGVCGNGESL